MENPNSDFPDKVEFALQNQEVVPTPPLASRARNLGATAPTLFSDILKAQDAEIFSANIARLIDIVSAKIQQPPPLVSQPQHTVESALLPRVTTPTTSLILPVLWSEVSREGVESGRFRLQCIC